MNLKKLIGKIWGVLPKNPELYEGILCQGCKLYPQWKKAYTQPGKIQCQACLSFQSDPTYSTGLSKSKTLSTQKGRFKYKVVKSKT